MIYEVTPGDAKGAPFAFLIEAAARERSERHEAIVAASWALEDAGCRAVALDPPSGFHGRSIVFLHERPRRFLSRRRCFCAQLERR